MAKATLPQSTVEVYTLYKLLFPNGKLYWGITKNTAYDRWLEHLHNMCRGSSLPVYNAIRKYGPSNVQVLTQVIGERAYIKVLEIAAIAAFKTRDRQFGYNISLGGDMGLADCPEVRARISATDKERFKDPDVLARHGKMSRDSWADPVIRARRIAALNRPEVSAAKSKKLTGQKRSAETCAKLKAVQADPDVKRRKGESYRATWAASPDLRARHSARLKGCTISDVQKAQISSTVTATWQDPVMRANHMAALTPEVRVKKVAACKAGQTAAWADPIKAAARRAKLQATWERKRTELTGWAGLRLTSTSPPPHARAARSTTPRPSG